jgi:cytochrome P450
MVVFNPFAPELRTNPYPTYKALRDEDPVHWNQIMQTWIITRYDDVFAVLRDQARFSSDRTRATNPFIQQMESYRQASGPVGRTPTMLSIDPPAHTRMRNLVNKAFTPRAVERIRPHIQEITDELLDALPDNGRLDVIADLAIPLPVIVIAELLGVPVAERERFKAWSSDIASTLAGPFQPADVLDRAQRSANDLADYFREKLNERRSAPRDDLLSALLQAEEQGDLLSEDELLATCILLLVAGNETTTNLIANGILALIQHPEELQRLQADPSLIGGAVEEILRFDGPAQLTSRVATESVKMRGKQIEPGQVIIVSLGAANRDPAQFPDPDRLIISREPNRHLAFGFGIHYCLGAPLAVAEAQVAINTLLRRYPDPSLASEPQWGASFILRGLKQLEIVSKVGARPSR